MRLTAPQRRILSILTTIGSGVGAARTDDLAGYVHVRAARTLLDLGLVDHRVSATGADCFLINDAGVAALHDAQPERVEA